ncbi:alpha/beta fold hydrolase [Crocinitomicaceae bacterium]|nr:alpha/beta fold hydrolase [Crocinitomicaceae bacterium]
MLHYEIVEKTEPAEAIVPTLVCLHGFLESLAMWSELHLEETARLILIDLPGHGQSNLEYIDTMYEMSQGVYEVLQKENVESYKVLGHSMGGYVALELSQMDAKCDGVILMNSNVWTDSDQKVIDRQRVAKLVETKKERFVSEAIPNLFQAPENHSVQVESLIQEAISMEEEAIGRASIAISKRRDFSEAVFSGALSVNVIQGENDPIAPKDRMEQLMVHHMENFHVVASGHMAHLEATEDVIKIVSKIL